MSKKTDAPTREKERGQFDRGSGREEALKALRRLRELGEKLPEVDAAALVREGRDATGRGSR